MTGGESRAERTVDGMRRTDRGRAALEGRRLGETAEEHLARTVEAMPSDALTGHGGITPAEHARRTREGLKRRAMGLPPAGRSGRGDRRAQDARRRARRRELWAEKAEELRVAEHGERARPAVLCPPSCLLGVNDDCGCRCGGQFHGVSRLAGAGGGGLVEQPGEAAPRMVNRGRVCVVDGCGRPAVAKLMCRPHYGAMRRSRRRRLLRETL